MLFGLLFVVAASGIILGSASFTSTSGRYAVGAYNINNLEQTVGLFRGNLGKATNEDRADPAEEREYDPPCRSERGESNGWRAH